MLRIKPVIRYTIPRYPRGLYEPYPDIWSRATPRGALTAALMTMLLEACDGGGTTGPPPLPPEMVTESEARTIVDQVFATNGISLTHDVDLRIETAPGDTADVNIDGFNDSLHVGYEYLSEQDYQTFTTEVRAALDSLNETGGPYVRTIALTPREQVALLEAVTQEFIDSLRASGAI